MKQVIIFILMVFILSSCAAGSIKTTEDGQCQAAYVSWFKSSDDISLSACGAKGSAANSQQQLSEAMVDVLLKGLGK